MEIVHEERATGFRAGVYRTRRGQRRLQIHLPTFGVREERELAMAVAKLFRDYRRRQASSATADHTLPLPS